MPGAGPGGLARRLRGGHHKLLDRLALPWEGIGGGDLRHLDVRKEVTNTSYTTTTDNILVITATSSRRLFYRRKVQRRFAAPFLT